MPRTIFVTGGSGFIGSEVCRVAVTLAGPAGVSGGEAKRPRDSSGDEPAMTRIPVLDDGPFWAAVMGVRLARRTGTNAKNAWHRRGCGRVWGAALGLLAFLGCAPNIPHPISSHGDSACRTCHVGRAGAPSSHDKAGCVSCHEPGSTGPYPRLMPHRGGEVELCSLCHRDGTAGAPVTSHIQEQDCYTCHQASEYGPYPPTPSHEVSAPERASCLACHNDVDHSDRPSCVECHQR